MTQYFLKTVYSNCSVVSFQWWVPLYVTVCFWPSGGQFSNSPHRAEEKLKGKLHLYLTEYSLNGIIGTETIRLIIDNFPHLFSSVENCS